MLSIIVPVYNVEKYLNRCLKSLVNQTYKNIEIILVDDGSTDNSGKICDEWQKKDNRIRVIHKENAGLVSAWTKGVEVSSGELIGFVDSDDYCDLAFFENLFNNMEHTRVDLVVSGYTFETQTKSIRMNASSTFENRIYEGEALEKFKSSLFGEGRALCWARWVKLFKRKLIIDNLKFVDERIKVGEDIAISVAAVYDAKVIGLVAEYGYHYVQNETSIMHTINECEIRNFEILCDNTLSICKQKGRGVNIHRFYTYQIIVLLSKILHSNISRIQKKGLLKVLRVTEYTKLIYQKKDFKWLSIKQRIAMFLFKLKMYGIMLVCA